MPSGQVFIVCTGITFVEVPIVVTEAVELSITPAPKSSVVLVRSGFMMFSMNQIQNIKIIPDKARSMVSFPADFLFTMSVVKYSIPPYISINIAMIVTTTKRY